MIEVLNKIQTFKDAGRVLDAAIIKGRTGLIGRNLGQIEGRGAVRHRVYIHRLAGKSADVVRKSQTERVVEWLGATVFENPQLLGVAREFYTALFATAADTSFTVLRDFWLVDEESDCLRAARRSAFISGDNARVLELTLELERNEREIAEIMRARVFLGEK